VILGSPIITNAGRNDAKSVSSCSVPPVKLSSMTRAEIQKMVGDYHTRGMGTGFCLDDLSDPIAMVKYLNSIAIAEVQNGQIERSVGNMGILSIDHPKALEFIRLKTDNPDIKEWKFNISINIPDAFIKALRENTPFTLKNQKEVNPAEIMRQIAECAHATGDPGLIFMDRINRLNRLPQIGKYQAAVTCGEVSLYEGEVCQFSYLNLPQFLKESRIDKDALRQATHTTVMLLDNAIEANSARMPNQKSAEIITSVRRIGIGICGFAELLHALGLPYGSAEAKELAADIMSFINFESKWASVLLAKERGPFNHFTHPQTKTELFIKPFAKRPTNFVSEQDWQRLEELFNAHKIRNVATTILPPTGRSSILAGVTASIEPPFRLVVDTAFTIALQRQCAIYHYTGNLETVYELVKRTGSVQSSDLPNEVKEIFKTALEIAPVDHLNMMATFQRQIDEGISKTVNIAEHSSVDDVAKVFLTAYDLDLKGITVYRNGSRNLQPKALHTIMTSQVLHDRIYGDIRISKRIASLLNSPLVTRLKGVHQNGTNFLIDPRQSTTRYEHCVGTLGLTQLLGGDESMQIAALLHDISHTAFSHVIDLVFANHNQNYHDVMRKKFLQSQDAEAIIKQCSITAKELACEEISMIKGEGLNVDRLDYCLRDLLAVNRIYQPEYSSILNNLVVDQDGEIKCTNIDTAKLIFNKFIEANLEIYFNPKAEVAAVAMTAILQAMLRSQLLTEEDFFLTEDVLTDKILKSPFKTAFEKIGPNMEFYQSNSKTSLPAVLRKLRFINPKIVGKPGKLTDYCSESKNRLETYLGTTPTKVFYQIPFLQGL
jgi:ribonucleoside-diphosphate reductase alpha chain